MDNEFTAICSHYYNLIQLLIARNERLDKLLAKAPAYTGQNKISDIDAIISYYRDCQELKAKIDKTIAGIKATEEHIRIVWKHFEIPDNKTLIGAIPGELEFELWKGDDDKLYILKNKSLSPEENNPNIIRIKSSQLKEWEREQEEDLVLDD